MGGYWQQQMVDGRTVQISDAGARPSLLPGALERLVKKPLLAVEGPASSTSSQPDSRKHTMDKLPSDLLAGVFSFLHVQDLATGTTVCKSFHTALQASDAWRLAALRIWARAADANVEHLVEARVRLGVEQCGYADMARAMPEGWPTELDHTHLMTTGPHKISILSGLGSKVLSIAYTGPSLGSDRAVRANRPFPSRPRVAPPPSLFLPGPTPADMSGMRRGGRRDALHFLFSPMLTDDDDDPSETGESWDSSVGEEDGGDGGGDGGYGGQQDGESGQGDGEEDVDYSPHPSPLSSPAAGAVAAASMAQHDHVHVDVDVDDHLRQQQQQQQRSEGPTNEDIQADVRSTSPHDAGERAPCEAIAQSAGLGGAKVVPSQSAMGVPGGYGGGAVGGGESVTVMPPTRAPASGAAGPPAAAPHDTSLIGRSDEGGQGSRKGDLPRAHEAAADRHEGAAVEGGGLWGRFVDGCGGGDSGGDAHGPGYGVEAVGAGSNGSQRPPSSPSASAPSPVAAPAACTLGHPATLPVSTLIPTQRGTPVHDHHAPQHTWDTHLPLAPTRQEAASAGSAHDTPHDQGAFTYAMASDVASRLGYPCPPGPRPLHHHRPDMRSSETCMPQAYYRDHDDTDAGAPTRAGDGRVRGGSGGGGGGAVTDEERKWAMRPFSVLHRAPGVEPAQYDMTPTFIAYFEVMVGPPPEQHTPAVHVHRPSCVAIGLGTKDFPLVHKMPGWDVNSYGYHGDDGHKFHSRGLGREFGPAYGEGDTVGCGLCYFHPLEHTYNNPPPSSAASNAVRLGPSTTAIIGAQHYNGTGQYNAWLDRMTLRSMGEYPLGSIFFTKNGRWLGWAFQDVPLQRPLYPLVGLDSWNSVTLNFGAEAFRFDVTAFEKTLLGPNVAHELLCTRLRASRYRNRLHRDVWSDLPPPSHDDSSSDDDDDYDEDASVMWTEGIESDGLDDDDDDLDIDNDDDDDSYISDDAHDDEGHE